MTLLNSSFFAALILYFACTLVHFVCMAFKKEKGMLVAWWLFLAATTLHTAYFIARGIAAGRLPLSNQFEFATGFALGISILCLVLHVKWKAEWIRTIAYPAAFLVLSYAALLPRDINDLMPALRSAWFSLHIGTVVFSYAAFVLAGCAGIRYLALLKRGASPEDVQMKQNDLFSYRLIAFGMLMLTVVILSGCIWAEQAWSAFWTWDPKETWALITWIVYAIYLHQRMRKKWQGKRMAIFAIIAVGIVLFTFIGVNQLLPGLHSYA